MRRDLTVDLYPSSCFRSIFFFYSLSASWFSFDIIWHAVRVSVPSLTSGAVTSPIEVYLLLWLAQIVSYEFVHLPYSVLYIGVRCRGRKQKRASASIVTPASPLRFCIAVTRPFDEQRSYATTPRRICRSLSHPWSAKHQWCPQLAITIISITIVAIIIITSASTSGMDDQRHEYVWVVLSM